MALSYTGVWNAVAALDAVGDDLLILPPPDLGNGPKIGGGSWQWGISSECNDADGARAYLEFSFQDEYITEFADKQVVIPATEAAAQASEYFGDDGALRPFVEFSQEYAVLRPETPAYAVISSHVRDRREGHHERRRRAGDARPRRVGHRREHRVQRRVRLPVIRRAGGGLMPPPAHPQRDLTMTVTPPTVAAEEPRRELRRFRSIKGRETWAGLGMIAPAGILLVLFLIIPVILAFALSFTNARLISPNPPRFVGLDNFVRAFTADPSSCSPSATPPCSRWWSCPCRRLSGCCWRCSSTGACAGSPPSA